MTIDGIYYVVDPGFVKQKVYNSKSGIDALVVTPISQVNNVFVVFVVVVNQVGRSVGQKPIIAGNSLNTKINSPFRDSMLSTSLTNDIINCYSALYGQRYPGGTQANAGRISPLKSLVRQLQYSLHRWEMVALRAVSCTSVRSIRTLTRPLTTATVIAIIYEVMPSRGTFV